MMRRMDAAKSKQLTAVGIGSIAAFFANEQGKRVLEAAKVLAFDRDTVRKEADIEAAAKCMLQALGPLERDLQRAAACSAKLLAFALQGIEVLAVLGAREAWCDSLRAQGGLHSAELRAFARKPDTAALLDAIVVSYLDYYQTRHKPVGQNLFDDDGDRAQQGRSSGGRGRAASADETPLFGRAADRRPSGRSRGASADEASPPRRRQSGGGRRRSASADAISLFGSPTRGGRSDAPLEPLRPRRPARASSASGGAGRRGAAQASDSEERGRDCPTRNARSASPAHRGPRRSLFAEETPRKKRPACAAPQSPAKRRRAGSASDCTVTAHSSEGADVAEKTSRKGRLASAVQAWPRKALRHAAKTAAAWCRGGAPDPTLRELERLLQDVPEGVRRASELEQLLKDVRSDSGWSRAARREAARDIDELLAGLARDAGATTEAPAKPASDLDGESTSAEALAC